MRRTPRRGSSPTVDDAEVRAIATRIGYRFPQVRDRDLQLTRRFGVRGTPAIVVVGPDGVVRYSEHRLPADWTPYVTCKDGVCAAPE